MTDYLKNPNVKSAHIEKVPCSFAKPNKDGSLGTHYTMVLTDKKGNIMFVGSECEHKHGDAIEFFHSEGATTCFAVTATFRNMLGAVKSSNGLLRYNVTDALPAKDYRKLNNTLQYAITEVWTVIRNTHNTRSASKGEDRTVDLKTRALQTSVTNLANYLMTLPKSVVLDPTKTLMKGKLVTPFKVVTSFSSIYTHELYPVLNDQGTPFASRKWDGTWDLSVDAIKRHAGENSTPVDYYAERNERGNPVPELNHGNMCAYCGESFTRMSKHTSGAKHIDRAVEIVRLICKANSPTGLKMMNNPKHRSAFFR